MAASSKGTLSAREAIHVSGKAPSPLGSYSHAVKAGDFLFLSGQGARNPDSGLEEGVTLDASGKLISYDIDVQTRAVMRNMIVVLKAGDCDLKDLVDVSVFLADINDFSRFNQIYAEYMNFDGPPARTTVQAAALPGKNFIEIKAVAFCPQRKE